MKLVFKLALLALCGLRSGWASVLDTDYYCQTYGCLMTHDGVATDVYDVYVFAGGGTVPPGGRLIRWTGNPLQGSGPVDVVETGSITPAAQDFSALDQGTLLAVDSNGDGIPDLFPTDANSNGFLDAADLMSPFSLDQQTRVVWADASVDHSFYVTSVMAFDIRARASLISATDDFSGQVSLNDVSVTFGLRRRGNDGVPGGYGQDATLRRFSVVPGIQDLGDLAGGFTTIAECRRNGGVRRRTNNSSRVYRQSVRFDMRYGLPPVDFSRGRGGARFEVEYAFFRR